MQATDEDTGRKIETVLVTRKAQQILALSRQVTGVAGSERAERLEHATGEMQEHHEEQWQEYPQL